MKGWLTSKEIECANQAFSLYGTLNALVMGTLVLLSVISHARAAYFDPGLVPLPKKRIDFSDVQSNDSTNTLLKVRGCSVWNN